MLHMHIAVSQARRCKFSLHLSGSRSPRAMLSGVGVKPKFHFLGVQQELYGCSDRLFVFSTDGSKGGQERVRQSGSFWF